MQINIKYITNKQGAALIRATRRDIHRRGLSTITGVSPAVATSNQEDDEKEFERLQELCDVALIQGRKTKKYRDELKKLKRY